MERARRTDVSRVFVSLSLSGLEVRVSALPTVLFVRWLQMAHATQ